MAERFFILGLHLDRYVFDDFFSKKNECIITYYHNSTIPVGFWNNFYAFKYSLSILDCVLDYTLHLPSNDAFMVSFYKTDSTMGTTIIR